MNRPNAIAITTAALVVLAGASVLPQSRVWTFDELPAGRPLQGFLFTPAPAGVPAPWQMGRDGENAILSHVSQERGGTSIAVVEGTSFVNVTMSGRVRFGGTAGTAGLAWRYKDPDNYFAVALDLRSQNIRIYRVAGGNRTRLEDEDDLELDPAVWHSLKIEHEGMRMRVWLDGVPVASARDRRGEDSGAIGVWATSDAAVSFDDLRAEPLNESPKTPWRD